MVNNNRRTLFVTSFTETMFRLSGQRLINSFLTHGIDRHGDLLCCAEGFHAPLDGHPSLLQYNLDESSFLNEWVRKYARLIPVELGIGGKATVDTCPKAYSRWNYRAALWFRKIASLYQALKTVRGDDGGGVGHGGNGGERYQRIVWIDSDCEWLQPLPMDFWEPFDKHRCLYHFGPIRERVGHGIESGLLVFNPTGYYLLEKVFKMYLDGDFENCKRWDDGWIFKKVLLKEKKGCHELVYYPLPPKTKTETEVILRGPFRSYVRHDKGRHTFLFKG